MSDEAETPTDGGPATQVRDTAKWLVTSFGAVVAVLVGGLSLSGIGGIDDWPRLAAVVVGLLTTTVAVARAMLNAADVLVVDPVTMADLADLEEHERAAAEDPTVLGPATCIKELREKLPEHQQAAHAAFEAHLRDVSNHEVGREYDVQNVRFASWHRAGIETVRAVRDVRVLARFKALRKGFTWQIPGVLFGVLVLAWGLGAGDRATAGATASEVLPRTPTVVEVDILDDGPRAGEFVGVVGSDCISAGAVPGVALAVSGARYTVAVVPSGICTAGIVDVGPDDATVTLPAAE